MYKPNFCAECGERILRARWHLWTSKRFCNLCARRMSKQRFLFPLLAVAIIFSIGLITGLSLRKSPPPLIVEQGRVPALPVATENSSAAPKVETNYGPDGTDTERPTDPNETVSICGARTKKGTPCSRRVRGTGRCWQHKKL
jgi:hypothetical protein